MKCINYMRTIFLSTDSEAPSTVARTQFDGFVSSPQESAQTVSLSLLNLDIAVAAGSVCVLHTVQVHFRCKYGSHRARSCLRVA